MIRTHCSSTAHRLISAIAAIALAIFTGADACAAGAVARPNLLFILTDDQRWDSLGCAGNPVVQTPNIDQLAARGTRFRNAFVSTSICCVSRASLLSGQCERRHRIADFATPFTPAQWRDTYPAVLRSAGYRTGFIGKFGVGDAKAIAAMAPQFDYWRGLPGQAGLFIQPKDPSRKHATSRFGDQALEFLRGSSNATPWCLSISFSAPHARDGEIREFEPDVRDELLYADTSIALPVLATDEAHERLPAVLRQPDSEARARWRRRYSTPGLAQQTVRDYYRLITGIDREIGRILAELHATGAAANTVVVFTSDNGFALGDRGLADKWFMYEESIRVPMIIADLRRASAGGRVVEPMVLNIDVATTLLDYAGAATPAAMQGRSLRPWVEGGRVDRWRNDWFYEHHFSNGGTIPSTEGVRTPRWKYTRYIDTSPVVEELFDLRRDPLETRNLAGSMSHRRTLRLLRSRWEQLGRELK